MGFHKWHAAAAGAVLLAIGVAVGRCDGRSTKAEPAVSAPAVVPAPADLLAEIVVASPDASWAKLQRGVGGAAGILPSTLPGVLAAAAELDPAVAGELDGTAPMFGVLAGTAAEPEGVLAIKLADPRRARSVLGATPDAGRSSLALGYSSNGYLLVARRATDLERLGRYAAEGLATRHASAPPRAAVVASLPRGALARQIVPALDRAWKDARSFLLAEDERMRAKKGRAPDFAEPAAIVAALDAIVARRLAIAADLERARVELDVTDDALVLAVTLSPGSGAARAWVDGMRVGSPAPALALPVTSALAFATHGEADVAAQGGDAEKAIATALGARLEDPSRLDDVIEAVARARGGAFALALSADEPHGVFLRAPVRDAAAAERAIRGAFDLLKVRPARELLRVQGVASGDDELPGLGKVSVLTATREAPSRPTPARGVRAGAPAALGAAWTVVDGALVLGAGPEPSVTLRLGARPDHALGGEPALARFVRSIGDDAEAVAIAQPLRLDPKRASLPTAPLAIALGRRGGEAFVHVDLADALLRELVRSQMGL